MYASRSRCTEGSVRRKLWSNREPRRADELARRQSDFLKKRDQLYKELTDTHDKLAIIEKTFENLFAQIFQQEWQMDNLKSQLNSSEQNKKSAEKAWKKPSQQLLQRIKEIEKNIKKQKDILNTSNAQLNQETQKINQLGYKNHRDVWTHKSMIKWWLDMLDNKIVWGDLLK
jgi:chromosome segregation ATPase